MARARVLSPEWDSLYLGFDCHRRMEMSSVMTLSSATPFSWSYLFRSLSARAPKISYVGFFASRSFGYAPWSPLEFRDSPQIQWGLRWMGLMAAPALSRISSGWMFWPGNIFRSSVWRRISPSAHWCLAEFLKLPHQCVHSSCLRMAFPRWEGSWCRLPCWERWNQWGWRNFVFSPEYSWQFPWVTNRLVH
jgi:hypothetical protein